MSYVLRGVPKVFQSESQVLKWLTYPGNAGYVSRQEAYLKKYWPGLSKKIGLTDEVKTPASTRGPKTVKRPVTKGKNLFDVLDSVPDAPSPAKIAKAYVGAGKVAGKIAKEQGLAAARVIGSTAPGTVGPVKIAQPGLKGYSGAQRESDFETLAGKSLTNLVAHGDTPKNTKEVLGLVGGVMAVVPGPGGFAGKAGKAIRAASEAEKAASAGAKVGKKAESLKAEFEALAKKAHAADLRGDHAAHDRLVKQMAENQAKREAASQVTAKAPWEGLKPGEWFEFKGPKGKQRGYLDHEGVPRNASGDELFGAGRDYPASGMKSEIQAKLASGDWEYTGPVDKTPDFPPAGEWPGSAAPITPKAPTVEDAIAQVRQELKNAPANYKQQKALRSEEMGRRFEEQGKIAQIEGLDASKRALLGELPVVRTKNGPMQLSDDVIDQFHDIILDHPDLMMGQKNHAWAGFKKMMQGKTVAPNERKLLLKAIGPEAVEDLSSMVSRTFMQRAGHVGLELWNTPRALQASFDLSAPLRQGLVAGMRHPIIFKRNIMPMIKAAGSEKYAEAVQRRIFESPNYPYYDRMKIHIGAREEPFQNSHWSEVVPGVKQSSRGYDTFLEGMRADVADWLLKDAKRKGVDIEDDKFLSDLGRFVNDSTGRGELWKFESAAKVLSVGLFSPRLIGSRVSLLGAMLGPAGTYAKTDPYIRRQALIAGWQTLGTITLVLGLAKAAGANVEADPRNSDFGKIQVGNTRIDIAGGFQQYFHLLANLATVSKVSPTTGESRQQLPHVTLGRFLRSKGAPSPNVVYDLMSQKNFMGESVRIKDKGDMYKEFKNHTLPLLLQDSIDIYRNSEGGVDGIAKALGGYGIGMWGVGTQTFEAKEPKPSKATGPSSSDDDFWGGSGGSGGSGGEDSFWGGTSGGESDDSFWGG